MTGVRGRRYPAIDLPGAVVVITGGGRGIGKATGAAFAARGATVCLGDIDEQAAYRAAGEIGRGARAYQVDVTARGSFSAFIDTVLAELGGVDVLVNNAGVWCAAAGPGRRRSRYPATSVAGTCSPRWRPNR